VALQHGLACGARGRGSAQRKRLSEPRGCLRSRDFWLTRAQAAAAIRAVEEAEGEKKPKKAEEVFIPTPMIKEAAEVRVSAPPHARVRPRALIAGRSTRSFFAAWSASSCRRTTSSVCPTRGRGS
jgi:hypothetical protein